MDDFEKHLEESLKDDEFKNLWIESDAEFQIAKLVYSLRNELGLTQKELAEKTGINQSNISKLEKGSGNITLKTLDRIIKSLGKKLTISAV